MLAGTLTMPERALVLVLFAHGSGSSRHSPRNRFVAPTLRKAGLGTLLFDLLTGDEEAEDLVTGRLRFDIPFLAGRLLGATDWIAHVFSGVFSRPVEPAFPLDDDLNRLASRKLKMVTAT
jgi:hypothetical protein